jgi:tetratricopeptide (TPR) repeat protein
VRRILFPAVLVAAVFAAFPAQAQQRNRVLAPPRPPLPAAADTNDASAYYNLGLSLIDREPAAAASAFYWASRINPGWADPLYARRAAILLSDKPRLLDYWNGVRRVERLPEMRHADSLYDRAVVMDPFLYRRFDKQVFTGYLSASATRWLERNGASQGGANQAEINSWILQYMQQAPASMRAWSAYNDGRFADALTHYDRAIREARRDKWGLYADRSRVAYLMGADSVALADMGRAVADWKKDEEKDDDVVWLYRSKALLEHSMGLIHERMRNLDAAREAYGRALQEDLSYYPAHTALARMALTAGDTATAISEMDLAVQIRGDSPRLRTEYGVVLAGGRRYQEAVEQFKKAVELEPMYALPYFYLARIYDGSGMTQEATESYQAYVDHAAQREPQVPGARARLAELTAQAAAERAAIAGEPAAAPAEPAPATPAATPAEARP